jgi:chromosomal replication initiator protein
MNELQSDLPKASFETWVRDAVAISFDGQTLGIAVRNAYVCDWLKGRLETKIVAMLGNYLHKNIALDFVVGKIEDEQE